MRRSQDNQEEKSTWPLVSGRRRTFDFRILALDSHREISHRIRGPTWILTINRLRSARFHSYGFSMKEAVRNAFNAEEMLSWCDVSNNLNCRLVIRLNKQNNERRGKI